MEFDERYFQKNYRSYTGQNPPRKLNFYGHLLRQAMPAVKNPRVLEVGCAFGLFLQSLPPEWDLAGQDASEFAIGKASERLPGVRLAARLLPELAFPGPYDAIVAFDILEHVPDIDGSLEALYQALAPGGVLIFAVPVYDGPCGPIIRALDKDETHVHTVARSWWLGWAARRLRVESWVGVFRYFLPWGYYMHFPTRLFRSISPAIVVVARKA